MLGPGPQAHVPLPDMAKDVLLYRHKDGLGVRYSGTYRVNGRTAEEREGLPASATVTGPDFSFAVEPARR